MSATDLQAIAFVAFLLGWNGGYLPLLAEGSDIRWVSNPQRRLVRLVQPLEGLDVSVGLPCEERSRRTLATSTVLWAWVQGSDQLARAYDFRPLPSLVLRMGNGSRRLLVWLLNKAMATEFVETANRRIAYALHAPQKWAAGESLQLPLPGTLLRLGRTRPVPVVVTRMELDDFDPKVIVGQLREPPERYDWRNQ